MEWVLLDFGVNLGIDIIRTKQLEESADKDRVKTLTNELFDFNGQGDSTAVTFLKGKKRYAAKVLRFGDTKADLEPSLACALAGKPIVLDEVSSTPLGRGKRNKLARKFDSYISSSSDDEEFITIGNKEKRKTKKANLGENKTISEKLVQKLMNTKQTAKQVDSMDSSDSEKSEGTSGTSTKLLSENKQLKKENRALRLTLSTLDALPQLLYDVQKMTASKTKPKLFSTSSSSSKSSSPPKMQPSPHPHPHPCPPARDSEIKLEDGTILVSAEKLAMITLEKGPRKVINDLLLAAFSADTLRSSSLTGGSCNIHKDKPSKPPLPQARVNALRDYVQKVFPSVKLADLNRFIREKLVNESRERKAK